MEQLENTIFQEMGPSLLNIHFCWVGVLCFYMDLGFAGEPLKVGILWAKMDVLAFLCVILFVTLHY